MRHPSVNGSVLKYLAVARIYLSLSARSASVLGAPIIFGIFLVSAIVFGPTGMRPVDLVFTIRSSPAFAVALWLGWLILVFPVARLALIPPSSLYLRWLPAPRFVLYLAAALAAFVAELPWFLLFTIGENVFSGLSAAFAALALHALATVRPLSLRHGIVALGSFAAVFVPVHWFSLPVATLMALVAVKFAVDRAPEVHALARGQTRVLPPMFALARIHITYLLRKESAVLGRLLIASSLAGLVIPLAARGFDVETPAEYGRLTLIVSAVFLSPGLSGVAAAVIRSERFAAWITDVLGTSLSDRCFGAAWATAFVSIAAGLGAGLAALGSGHLPIYAMTRIMLFPVLWGLVVATMGTGLARESDFAPKRGDRGMLFALVIMIVGVVSVISWGEVALVLQILLAAVALFLAPRRALRIRRLRGTS